MSALSIFKVTATGPSGKGGPVDADEIRKAASLLFDPAHAVQIQALPSGRWKIVRGSDVEGVVAAAKEFADEKGVYWSLSPCAVTQSRPITKEAMVCRRWLLVDVDPRRPADTNSTEDEHDAARETAGRVLDALAEEGWPLPAQVDSGNGWHLLYRLDLPNDDMTAALVKRALHAVIARFETAATEIDRKVTNANRISKLPGTWARKGPHSEQRPHRLSRLAFVPHEVVPVSRELLEKVGNWKEVKAEKSVDVSPSQQPTKPSANPLILRVSGDDNRKRAYAKRAMELEEARVALAPVSQRNNTLNDATFRLATLVGAALLLRQEVEDTMFFAAVRAGLPEDEARKTIKSAMDAGIQKPREIPESPSSNEAKAKKLEAIAPAGTRIIVWASEITPKKIEWLWPYRIPRGKLTTFAGMPGLGKTFVLLDVAARISRGGDWPDSNGECVEAGNVMYLSAEDGMADTLVPRLIELGADRDRIAFLKSETNGYFTLDDLKTLDRALGEMGGAKLVVFDPPTSFLGDVNDHKNAELRGLLTPLTAWADRNNIAVVLNTHLNKGSGAKVDAISRVAGSIAWVAASRVAHLFSQDQDDEDRRYFIPMKMNIGKKRKGLAYRIVSMADDLAKVEWLGEIETTANQAVNSEPGKPRRVVAGEWLIDKFRERLEWPSDDLFKAAANEGIARAGVWEAKTRLCLPKPRKITHESGNTEWVWWVPADWPPLSGSSVPLGQKTEHLEHLDEIEL